MNAGPGGGSSGRPPGSEFAPRQDAKTPRQERAMAENPPSGNAERSEAELWTISAGDFSAAMDAFAVAPPENPDRLSSLRFLSMLGPQSSLKAIWSSLLNSPPKPGHLTPGADELVLNEEMITCQTPAESLGTWTTRLANRMGWHAGTYSKIAEYSHERDDFLLVVRPGEDPAKRRHRFLDRRVSIPLHRSWAGWLWERGLEKVEIQPLECLGIRAWRCIPKPEQLEEDLSRGVAQGVLTLEN